MHNGYQVSKTRDETISHLGCQGNLWNQDNGCFPHGQGSLNKMKIDFRLTRTRHSFQQERFATTTNLTCHDFNSMRLLRIKLQKICPCYLFKVAIGTIDLNLSDDQSSSFNEKLNHISRKQFIEVSQLPRFTFS